MRSLSCAHPQAPSSTQHCEQRIMPHSLDLFMLTIFHQSTFFFKGRKLVFLYLLWMGYFLPIYNSLEMLFRNLDDEVKNKSFVQPWSSWERKNEWRPHSKASRATSSFHESRRIALHHCREHLSMRQDGREKGMLKPGHSKFSLSISIKGLREICFIKRQMC